MVKLHTFHIPVMGTAFSIDTPIKVARYGISSVISLVDDVLIENMRKYYCGVAGEEYVPITKEDPDYRANRITAYLNLVDQIVQKQFVNQDNIKQKMVINTTQIQYNTIHIQNISNTQQNRREQNK